MSAPSGYTALDFVGFTDKGTYSPIVNYMRNDLVHYGGNIMRCLIDNTKNVTPVVGANWELWVGASANLVERVIAPIENNPADVAFGVGRQIIYDDWLWEVIAPIEVGDALIDYAVDPTNANIKKSAPVETQLLAVKAEADATDNMIAPTEASASSSSAAYSIGDQLILNNILYDVIADIQIGDALTTGTGGNIAAADTLTDQIKAKANSSDLGTAAAKDSTNAVTSGSTDLVESGAVASELATIDSSIQTLKNNDDAILNVLGAKNLLPNKVQTSVNYGLTFTRNSDDSITVTGNKSDDSSHALDLCASLVLKAGEYLLSDGLSDVDNINILVYDKSSGTTIASTKSRTSPAGFDLASDTEVGVNIEVRGATTVVFNYRLYPMIRPASVADDTYVPYAMTNRELTERLIYDEQEVVISDVPAKDWKNGTISHSIPSGYKIGPVALRTSTGAIIACIAAITSTQIIVYARNMGNASTNATVKAAILYIKE